MKLWPLRAHRGVTLVELMIVLAILGILIGLVAPNYSTVMGKVYVAAESRRIISILKQARNEARARGATVTVRRNAGDWASDIIVYESTQVAGTVK